jgi:hypothetical protein
MNFLKKIVIASSLLLSVSAFGALGANTIWEFRSSATASMVNGGGFNTGNANFPTDLTTDSNTGNTASPVVSSATYNFAAGDVNAWVYVKSGTSWTPGFYQIASVASNKATLSAGVGQAVQLNATTNMYVANTVAGVATVGTPTGGVFGIDYSQQDSAILSATDLASVNGTTTPSDITSALQPFGVNHIGNIIHVTAGTNWTAGWYEIVSVSVVTATLDRAVGSAATLSSGTAATGGALSLNSTLDDDLFEAAVAQNLLYFRNGTFSVGENISVASSSATTTNPISVIGYNSLRGDRPIAGTRPILNAAAQNVTLGANWNASGLIVNGTATTVFTGGTNGTNRNIKVTNTSTTANRAAFSAGADSMNYAIEAVAQNGLAISAASTNVSFVGCYAHDSTNGFGTSSSRIRWINNISAFNRTSAIDAGGSPSSHLITQNTLYGFGGGRGTGVLIGASSDASHIFGNIISAFTTGLTQTTSQRKSNTGAYNVFYGNTTDYSNYFIDPTDIIGTNPQFTSVTEITGSTATTSGSVLTQSGGDFSTVTDNVDYLHVFSGTSVTTGGYLITSHTGTTLTVNNALGSSVAGNVVYSVPTGRNFSIGTNLKAASFPGLFPGSSTTGYMDTGAVQRQESGGISRSRLQRGH